MKIIAITILFLLMACNYDSPMRSEKYPGSNGRATGCIELWGLGWLREPGVVDKCEKHKINPKFKIGQTVKLKINTRYASNCIYQVTGNWEFAYASKFEGLYNITISCGKESFNERFLESELLN